MGNSSMPFRTSREALRKAGVVGLSSDTAEQPWGKLTLTQRVSEGPEPVTPQDPQDPRWALEAKLFVIHLLM